jgi:hypothetical protein
MMEEFEESKNAFMFVPDIIGPLNPAPSFQFKGKVYINDNSSTSHQTLGIYVKGYTGLYNITSVPLPKISYNVKALLQKDGQTIAEKQVVRTIGFYQADLLRDNYTIVGEADFILPTPEDANPLQLVLEGSYIANFGHPTVPTSINSFPFPETIRKTFTISVNTLN